TGYYSIVAIDKNTGYPLWTTPVGYNPPEGMLLAGGKLVFTAGGGALMALDKGTGAIIWSVQDQPYSGTHVVSGNTLFTFNNTSPPALYAFDLATGGQLWQVKMSNVTDQFGGLWMYGKNLCFYAYEFPNSYLETVDPATGDSISRVTVSGRYEYPLLVGHRIYARKTWDNTTNRSLVSPQFVVLDAASLAVKDSAVITGFEEQITSMLVIGKSGATY
ncbi:MAG TPA: PQQ-binding-like beta-propeller repeat protein, partial [Puia sp.]|nr:PQQ-binding-like beta-propeller repeat protein [Puia sp.]